MSRRHISRIGLLAVLLFTLLMVPLIPTVLAPTAIPVLEESFTGLGDGVDPSGWTLLDFITSDDVGGNTTVFTPTASSLQVNTSDGGTNQGISSPTFDLTSYDTLHFGWYFRIATWPNAADGDVIYFYGNDGTTGLGSNFDLATRIVGDADGSYTVQVCDCGGGPTSWITASTEVVIGYWYQFQWVVTIDGASSNYDFAINGTEEVSNTPTTTSAANVNTWQVGWAKSFIISAGDSLLVDWVSVGRPSITSTADTTATVNQLYEYQVTDDASGEITWSLETWPSYLSISSTGLISGTPTSTGSDSVIVRSTNSASFGQQSYTLVVSSPGGGGPTDPLEPPVDESELDIEGTCRADSKTLRFTDATVPAGSALLYIWDFGDGTRVVTSTNPSVEHTYLEDGTYRIDYAVALSDGTTFRAQFDATVGECVAIVLSDVIIQLPAFIIATAAALWLVFVFTRNVRIMKWALIFTLVGVSGWTLLLGL